MPGRTPDHRSAYSYGSLGSGISVTWMAVISGGTVPFGILRDLGGTQVPVTSPQVSSATPGSSSLRRACPSSAAPRRETRPRSAPSAHPPARRQRHGEHRSTDDRSARAVPAEARPPHDETSPGHGVSLREVRMRAMWPPMASRAMNPPRGRPAGRRPAPRRGRPPPPGRRRREGPSPRPWSPGRGRSVRRRPGRGRRHAGPWPEADPA